MPSPGEILVHEKFLFSDGTCGKKIFVVLANQKESFLVCKTTSQSSKWRPKTPGCITGKNLFFFPQNEKIFVTNETFHKDTWVQFEELFSLKLNDVIKSGMNKDIRSIGTLKRDAFAAILNCILRSEDITGEEKAALTAVKKNLDQK
jgi:hypothetical protein